MFYLKIKVYKAVIVHVVFVTANLRLSSPGNV
jgi:hypothetical protein